MKTGTLTACMAVVLCTAMAAPAWADVFAMPGGQTSLEFVEVGNLNNVGDTVVMWQDGTTGYGVVDYVYNISKYEVTVAQYTQFLNAKAASDPYGLYRAEGRGDMTDDSCGILRSGSDGSYTYSVGVPDDPPPGPGQANRPVTYIDWGDAVRFANWVHNGQGAGDTETGAYALNGAMTDAEFALVTREEGAVYALPTEDEWYKAAYHKNNGPSGDYWFYPTAADTTPLNPADQIPTTNNATLMQGSYRPGAPYYRTEVGHWNTSPSPYGTFDQGGNVDEWTETAVGQKHVRRGGGWGSGTSPGANWRLTKLAHEIGDKHGFRLYKVGSLFGPGDLDEDGDIDADDIDLMGDYIRTGIAPTGALYDLTATGATQGTDGAIDILDLDYLVRFLVETTVGTGSEYGDFNLDGLIDTTDLTRLATNFGPGSTWAQGNANRNLDELIDTTDLTILGTYFGFDASVDTIPEPATMSLLALGGLVVLTRQRRYLKKE